MGPARWRPKPMTEIGILPWIFWSAMEWGVGIFVWLMFGGGGGDCDISVIFFVGKGGFGVERWQGYFRDCGLCRVFGRGMRVKEWKESSKEV